MEVAEKELREKEKKALLTFLKETSKGHYAKIDKSTLPYSRITASTEETIHEDEYYYSIR